jgi:hypothetical protein
MSIWHRLGHAFNYFIKLVAKIEVSRHVLASRYIYFNDKFLWNVESTNWHITKRELISSLHLLHWDGTRP